MSDLKVTKTAKVQVSGKSVKELKEILAQIPDKALVSFDYHRGDSRNQRDYSYTEITFTWTD